MLKKTNVHLWKSTEVLCSLSPLQATTCTWRPLLCCPAGKYGCCPAHCGPPGGLSASTSTTTCTARAQATLGCSSAGLERNWYCGSAAESRASPGWGEARSTRVTASTRQDWLLSFLDEWLQYEFLLWRIFEVLIKLTYILYMFPRVLNSNCRWRTKWFWVLF